MKASLAACRVSQWSREHDFMFRLSPDEAELLVSQKVIPYGNGIDELRVPITWQAGKASVVTRIEW